MPCKIICQVLFSLPEPVVKCVDGSSVGGRRCWLWAEILPTCSKWLLPLYVVGLLAPAAKLCAKSWQLFPHSRSWLPALDAARSCCVPFKTGSRAGVCIVLKDSWCTRVDHAILEHAILKEFCICTALGLLMALPLCSIPFFFFGLELYNVTAFSPCAWHLCLK